MSACVSVRVAASLACISNGAGVINIPVPGLRQRSEPRQLSAAVLFPQGLAPVNEELQSFCEKIKQQLKDQVRRCIDLKIQLALIVPKIQSGNTFGLMILGSFFMSLATCANESQVDLGTILKFNKERLSLIRTISQYPDCEDARCQLRHFDDNQWTRFQFYAEQMRTRYLLLQDLYLKNRERIHRPMPDSPISLF